MGEHIDPIGAIGAIHIDIYDPISIYCMLLVTSGQFGFAAGTLTARHRDGGLLGGGSGEKPRSKQAEGV